MKNDTELKEEDMLYLRYVYTLAQIDDEVAAERPNLTRLLTLKTKAEADRAELELMALRLSLMPREDAEALAVQMKTQMLSLAEEELKKILSSAVDNLEQNASSHPKIKSRSFENALQKACKQGASSIETQGQALLRDVREGLDRSRKIKELLDAASIEEHKKFVRAALANDA